MNAKGQDDLDPDERQSEPEPRRFCPSCGTEANQETSNCEKCWRPLPIGIGLREVSPVSQSVPVNPVDMAPDHQTPHSINVAPSPVVGPSVPIQSTSSVKKKGGKRRTLVALVLLAVVIALGAVIVATSRQSSGGGSAITAPPGSSKSFADGYTAALSECLGPNGQKVTSLENQECYLIPDLANGPSTSPSGYDNPGYQVGIWCQNSVNIGADAIPPSDDTSQWYAGCNAVVAKAKF
jgi:hypothetical protein